MNHLLRFARQLRKESTDAEHLLWQHLRAKRFSGFKFRRQQPIGPYIVDFVCYEKRLVIECDGGQHLEAQEDMQRDMWLQSQGFIVMRFWNNEIFENIDRVLEAIADKCSDHPPPDPLPSREGDK